MKNKPKIHFRRAGSWNYGCGLPISDFQGDRLFILPATDKPEKVTCKNCKKSRMFRLAAMPKSRIDRKER